MGSTDAPFLPDDEEVFVWFVSENIKKGAALRRGITDGEYVDLARRRWNSCKPDQVYAIKLLVDPLVQPELASDLPTEWTESGDPFCELIARIDSNGELVDAPPGYVTPTCSGVLLVHIPAGSPTGGVIPDPAQPADYLVAFLDVLGFEALLRRIGLEELTRRYGELLEVALTPHSEARSWGLALTLVRGQPTPALMWLPIQTAYFSDSLLLWVPYHPSHVPEFLDRCSRVFCEALALGLPLRGSISVGTSVLNKDRGVYLGLPLVEAVRLESKSNWIGIALAGSWKSDVLRIPVPPDRVFTYALPLKDGGSSLYSGLVLDWPRVWRESRRDSAIQRLRELCDPRLSEDLRARYDAAVAFYEHSEANQNWFLPPGAERLTPHGMSGRRR
mgnify:CR=1 FL=1